MQGACKYVTKIEEELRGSHYCSKYFSAAQGGGLLKNAHTLCAIWAIYVPRCCGVGFLCYARGCIRGLVKIRIARILACFVGLVGMVVAGTV